MMLSTTNQEAVKQSMFAPIDIDLDNTTTSSTSSSADEEQEQQPAVQHHGLSRMLRFTITRSTSGISELSDSDYGSDFEEDVRCSAQTTLLPKKSLDSLFQEEKRSVQPKAPQQFDRAEEDESVKSATERLVEFNKQNNRRSRRGVSGSFGSKGAPTLPVRRMSNCCGATAPMGGKAIAA